MNRPAKASDHSTAGERVVYLIAKKLLATPDVFAMDKLSGVNLK